MSRRVLLGLALAVFLGPAAACVTPSIPIPPPSPERMTFAVDLAAGDATFTYDPDASYAGALVYVFNRDQGQGIITTARPDGSVAASQPFPAADGDQVVVSFQLEDQLASTCVILKDGRSNSGLECDL